MTDMLNIALRAIKKVKKITQDGFNGSQEFEYKLDRSVVTDTDVRIESEIRNLLEQQCPGVPILGEEFGLTGSCKFETGWVIDPIDGTRAFLYGVPLFSTLIAFVENGEPTTGVISFPAISTIVYASEGQGCWMSNNDASLRRLIIQNGSPDTISHAVISASGIHSSSYHLADGTIPYNLNSLVKTAKDFMFINDCYQHAMVANGRIHCAIDTLMKPWDSAAILPCIKEAGGDYCTLNGSREKVMFGEGLVSACNSQLLDSVIASLNS
ncbi:inositol monophosphatase family protein [Photorhabdus bodei]|uniref:Histidinol-phosphate aminotransferase n=1 Tax=Photorhabdus bodei TaxID=2029681 RepID=A0AAW6BL98_9GAMM|nr:inositol monophosphatase family protein [Photorhabdus bodei]MDB6372560.1 histidinol-phosphate aminotransferase [Photorhabdus bodei]